MVRKVPVLIIGAGPAGLTSAISCAENGVKPLIVDEGIEPGGQLPKQTHKFFGHEGFFASKRGFEIAKILINKLKELDVEPMMQTSITGIYEDVIVAYNREKNEIIELKADYIVFATGASERFLVFENNHLPGVYGAGAVQTLMNQYAVLPGKRFLIVGSGNIGLILAYQLLQAGAEVRAIVEITNKIGGYMVHANKIKRIGVPILLNHTIVKAIGDEKVEGAVIAKVDNNFKIVPGTEKELVVDVITLSVGLQPSVELIAQAGVEIKYIPELGGYVPYRNEEMRTNIENVFVVGDVAGIEEATTAMIEGYIAGYTIAQEIKKINLTDKINLMKKELIEFRKGPFSSKVRKGLEKFGIYFPEKGYRTEQQQYKGPKGKLRAIIECPQNIPCNPCETSCPTGAINVGENINGIPHIDYDKCIGCGVCVMKCPGLAIFMVQERVDDSLVVIPYEFEPLPNPKEEVWLLNREGERLAIGKIEKVLKNKKDKTHLIYLSVPKGMESEIRHFEKIKSKKEYVCKCEEVTLEEVENAIEKRFTDYEELRRYLRIGMGPCGGRTCRLITLSILAKKTGKKIEELSPGTFRPPSIPLSFSAILSKRGES